MIEGERLIVRLVQGGGTTALSLQGDVLTYHHAGRVFTETIDIPLPWFSIKQRRQFQGRFLIISLLSLPLGPALGGLALAVWYFIHGNVPDLVLAVAMGSGAALGGLLFLVYLIRFFIRRATVQIWPKEEYLEATVNAAKNRQQNSPEPLAPVRAPLTWKDRAFIEGGIVVLSLPFLAMVTPWAVPGFLVGALLFQHLRRDISFTRADRMFSEFSFWVENHQKRETEELVAEILRRQDAAAKSQDEWIELPLRVMLFRPWRMTLAVAAMCVIPALTMENPRLLLLCAIPIASHALYGLLHLFEPEPYRTAVRCFRRGDWDGAYQAVAALVEAMPGHRKGRVLLVETLMQQNRLDDAEDEFAKAADMLDDNSIRSLWASLRARREMAHRKGICPSGQDWG